MPGMQTCFSAINCFRDSTAFYLRAAALFNRNLERRAFGRCSKSYSRVSEESKAKMLALAN